MYGYTIVLRSCPCGVGGGDAVGLALRDSTIARCSSAASSARWMAALGVGAPRGAGNGESLFLPSLQLFLPSYMLRVERSESGM